MSANCKNVLAAPCQYGIGSLRVPVDSGTWRHLVLLSAAIYPLRARCPSGLLVHTAAAAIKVCTKPASEGT
jgi:hypothetical protein